MIGFATLKGFKKGPGRRKHLRRAGLFVISRYDKIPFIPLLYASPKVIRLAVMQNLRFSSLAQVQPKTCVCASVLLITLSGHMFTR
jgi:hypothetical protein